ncbi:MAG: type I-E CRISPR-associated protein Cse2/CasB [Candidatus Riflebacteria bacterium]|nr:type I-E CRISPR-associated protein Cse2/CasB [Candidatus Riflebacteria bacterium]
MTDPRPPASPAPGQGPNEGRTLADTVNLIAHALVTYVGAGEVAALRRLTPDRPGVPAFYRVAARFLEPAGSLAGEGPARDLQEKRWACILNGLALLGGFHRPGQALGEALAEAGFSELRLVRLLGAQGPCLWDAVRGVARYLAAKGRPADWSEAAALVLGEEAAWGDAVRRRIARRYYSVTMNSQEGETTS